jgi:hypothetical protein
VPVGYPAQAKGDSRYSPSLPVTACYCLLLFLKRLMSTAIPLITIAVCRPRLHGGDGSMQSSAFSTSMWIRCRRQEPMDERWQNSAGEITGNNTQSCYRGWASSLNIEQDRISSGLHPAAAFSRAGRCFYRPDGDHLTKAAHWS